MVIVIPTAQGTLPQSREGVPLCIDRSLFNRGGRCMEQIAFFGSEQEEHAIDQPKKLLEE